jgi:hypothetical protein
MNILWEGSVWTLSERYTDMVKVGYSSDKWVKCN